MERELTQNTYTKTGNKQRRNLYITWRGDIHEKGIKQRGDLHGKGTYEMTDKKRETRRHRQRGNKTYLNSGHAWKKDINGKGTYTLRRLTHR